MIKSFRKRFITITTMTFVAVMVLMCLVSTLSSVYAAYKEGKKTIAIIEKDSLYEKTQEDKKLLQSAVYFHIVSDDKGNLILDKGNCDFIDERDLSDFVSLMNKDGYGFDKDRYFFYHVCNNKKEAVFLYSYSEYILLRDNVTFNILASFDCSLIGFLIALFWSKKAIAGFVENERKQKEFITDASHELKTPITVISTCLKLNEMENGHQKWIDKANGQAEKLSLLVTRLFELSKLDEEDYVIERKEFSFSDIVNECVDSFKVILDQKNLKIETKIEENVYFIGDPILLRQLLSIFLDNAMKYSLENSVIKVKLEKKKNIVLSCKNECENLMNIHPELLFERFYRVDKSRNRSSGGSGIGLSLAKSIVEAHNGTVSAEKTEERYLVFKAVF